MPRVEFGFIMPEDRLDKARRGTYVADLDRALRLVAGHFHGTCVIDHLQSAGAKSTNLRRGAPPRGSPVHRPKRQPVDNADRGHPREG